MPITVRFLSAVLAALLVSPALARGQSITDGFDPGANNSVRTIVVQPDGKTLVGGDFTMLGGGGTGITPRERIARLNPDGSLDAGFDPGANGGVRAFAVQPDGKILVGGLFTVLADVTESNLGRLNADGSIDGTFALWPNGSVDAIAMQRDGKVLIGGTFTSIYDFTAGNFTRNRIARLNANGSLDTSFNPDADGPVHAIALQADGKIVVGGAFSVISNQEEQNLARLNADGSADTSFALWPNGQVLALALQGDGKILAGGAFSTIYDDNNSVQLARVRLARLNAGGSIDTAFAMGTNAQVDALAVQADGDIVVGGSFTQFDDYIGQASMYVKRIGRIRTVNLFTPGGVDFDFNFHPGAGGPVHAVAVQPDGKILAGGTFAMLGGDPGGPMDNPTGSRSRIGRLYPDGSLDTDLDPGASSSVFAVAVQRDGKILAGGAFVRLGGGGSGTPTRNRIGRLSPDGSLDAAFNPGANGVVNALVLMPDGRILVGGQFTGLGGGTGTTPRSNIGRLTSTGAVDPFNPGANGSVSCIAVQPNGKILVGGTFSEIGGQEELNLAQLNEDGSVDTSFSVWTNGRVRSIALQPDGKILIGGDFTELYDDNAGTRVTRNRIARLNFDGSVDLAFDPGAANHVNVLAVQADGKILVGGAFTALGGGTGTTTRIFIGRLNDNGSVDTGFNPGADSEIESFAVQPDGRIIVAGAFRRLGGGTTPLTPRYYIGALAADGTLDPAFDPGANNFLFALALQPDGKIVAGGNFTLIGGGAAGSTSRSYLARLTNAGAAIQRVTASRRTVTWLRSGAGPELSRVTFESSLDGVSYSLFGVGSRVAGGWRLSGQTMPANQNLYLRARGYYATGLANGSNSMIESVRALTFSPLAFTDQPLIPGVTPVRALHITELRARIDALRVSFSLGAFAWTGGAVVAGTTTVQLVHLMEMRTALQQAYFAAGLLGPNFSDPAPVPQYTLIYAPHITELRNAIGDLEQR